MALKLKVQAKRPGFRRAGIEFSDVEPVLLDPKDLEKDQIEAIKSEPMLMVTEVDVKEDKKTENK